jgi:hypothetical protein
VIEEIVHNGVPVLTIRDIEDSLQVSTEAAARIVERLVSAGLLVETREGTWVTGLAKGVLSLVLHLMADDSPRIAAAR